jgi:DNA processing protein
LSELLENAYWLSLVTKDRLITIPRIERVFKQYNSLAPLWNESVDFLRDLGLSDGEIRKFLQFRLSFKAEDFTRLAEKLKHENIAVVRYVDPTYPKLLKDFGDYYIKPPILLLVKGSLEKLSNGVAIVGTRECSFYGHMMARRLARSIAKEGYFIVSGLARGVDTEAHCGALEASAGRTIAVLPWLDRIYPEENIKLSRDIERRGAIISEYYSPPFESSSNQAKAAFVIRNRITSGLCRCVILIESGMSGGTYRQATIAKEQGRKVFALKPRKENKEAFEGFKKFVEMGATPIESAKPVIEFMKQYPSAKGKEKKIDSF